MREHIERVFSERMRPGQEEEKERAGMCVYIERIQREVRMKQAEKYRAGNRQLQKKRTIG